MEGVQDQLVGASCRTHGHTLGKRGVNSRLLRAWLRRRGFSIFPSLRETAVEACRISHSLLLRQVYPMCVGICTAMRGFRAWRLRSPIFIIHFWDYDTGREQSE